jgi:hypothetical protein
MARRVLVTPPGRRRPTPMRSPCRIAERPAPSATSRDGGHAVGYELRRATRDALPPNLLTLAERNVLLELADFANDKTRLAYPGMEALSRACGLPEGTISKCLQRMAAKGLELRIPVGKADDGRAVVATRGRQTTYRIPLMAGPGSALFEAGTGERADRGPLKAGPGSAPSPHRTLKEERSKDASASRSARRPPTTQPQTPKPARDPNAVAATIIMDQLEADRATADDLVAYIIETRKPDDVVALVRYLADGLALASLFEEMENARWDDEDDEPADVWVADPWAA